VRGDAAYRDAQWLIAKVAIAQLPSTSAFTALRRAPTGRALRQSMLDLMGKKSPTGFSCAHPAFRAPFSLVGDGGR
jgi:hypothetical protein